MKTYICLLQCHHTAFFDPPPKLGDRVFCRQCQGYSIVERVNLEWMFRCATCRYVSRYGTDELGARRGAAKHAHKRTSHMIELWQGGKIIETIGPANCYQNVTT